VPVRVPDPGAHPSPDGAGLRVAVNPSSGPAWTSAPTDALRAGLPSAEVVELSAGDDLDAVLGGDGPVALGIAGGDGTVSAAARLAADRDLPLVVVPAGTLNHLARDLGLDDVDDAVAAVRSGTVTHMDLGTVADRTFVNTLAFGGYPELVDARERLERRLGKWPALVVALVRELPRLEPLRLELDGRPTRVWLAWIGNGRYDPSGFAPAWRPRLDDGWLDVRLVDGSRRWSRARLVAHVLTGRLPSCPVYEQRLARSVRIRSLDGPLRLAVDGETFDAPAEVEVAKLPRALTVAVPPPPAS
jgi:undecaprenyl-diphosphatase